MKLIILDRDGVINQDSDAYIKAPEEWIPLPGSLEAVARLNHAGYRVVVATNQSGVGRGLFDLETLNLIHKKMNRLTQEAGGLIEAVFFCPDVDEANPYRKPNPGMLLQAIEEFPVDLPRSLMVGDKDHDVEAGRRAGVRGLKFTGGDLKAFLEGELT